MAGSASSSELFDHGPDAVLDHLDPEQRAVATAIDGPVCVLAGAGTGKTRAITHRMAYAVLSGKWQPKQTLAVTFTTRAAGEMRTRLRELGVHGVQARTFHSAALRQARYFWPQVYGSDLPPIAESKFQFVGEAARRCRINADVAARRDLASEIEWAKVSNVRPDDYAGVATRTGRQISGYDAATVAHVFAAYEDVRRERGYIDLEDVLLCTAALLADNPKVAATVRAQYHHFVVDEYQDVNPLQQTLLDLWLGSRDEVCVVGDASQTIYSFAGATPRYLVEFPHRYPDATVVELVRDYRSTPQVVSVANAMFTGVRTAESERRLVLQAQRQDGPPATYTEYSDEVAEAEGVAAAIGELLDRGVPAREVAILFRINAMSEAFEQALSERRIPYVVRGAERFFDRAEVREAIVLLRGAARSGSVGAAPTEEHAGLVADVHAVLASTGWTPHPPTGTGATRERWESLAALAALAGDVAAEQPEADLAAFTAVLEERAAVAHAPAADGVTLATLHSAKGLEWDAVFVTGVVEGTVPISYAETSAQIEEERRLLYVGITRARHQLAVSWAAARTPGARARRTPSRFLDGVRPTDAGSDRAAVESRRSSRRSKTAARCRSCGRPLREASERKVGRCEDCPARYDEELFDRLRAWRSERARQLSVPAYVVFTDATLEAIAEACPPDRRALNAVPGVGAAKLERYAEDVLAICAGSDSTEPVASTAGIDTGTDASATDTSGAAGAGKPSFSPAE